MRRLLFVIFTMLLVTTLVDLYAFQGITTLLRGSDSKIRRLVYFFYWFVSAFILLLMVVLFLRFSSGKKVSFLFNKFFHAFLGLLITKLAFVFILFFEDLYRFVAAITNDFPRRSWGVSMTALCVSLFPFSAFIFGVTRGKYHYRVRHVQVNFKDLPEEFEGFRIVQISDIHAGSFDSVKDVGRGIEILKKQRPDLLVFTGDLVNNRAREILPYLQLFRAIEVPSGKLSVLGNHDYGDYVPWKSIEDKQNNFEELKKYHADMGFKLLLDDHVEIKRGDGRIVVLGVENWGLGFGHRGDLKKALLGVPAEAFKVLLSHDPTHWAAEVKNNPQLIHLTLSGHTHGMQFGIEAFGFKWSPAQYRYKHWAGLAQENGRYLYINRGFGFLGFSGRIGIWPEITVIHLHRKAQ